MNEIKCPYCKHGHEATGSHEDDATTWECNNCNEPFEVDVEYDPTYIITCADDMHNFISYSERFNKCKNCGDIEEKERGGRQ